MRKTKEQIIDDAFYIMKNDLFINIDDIEIYNKLYQIMDDIWREAYYIALSRFDNPDL